MTPEEQEVKAKGFSLNVVRLTGDSRFWFQAEVRNGPKEGLTAAGLTRDEAIKNVYHQWKGAQPWRV